MTYYVVQTYSAKRDTEWEDIQDIGRGMHARSFAKKIDAETVALKFRDGTGIPTRVIERQDKTICVFKA